MTEYVEPTPFSIEEETFFRLLHLSTPEKYFQGLLIEERGEIFQLEGKGKRFGQISKED